jgi:hypothetical protein
MRLRRCAKMRPTCRRNPTMVSTAELWQPLKDDPRQRSCSTRPTLAADSTGHYQPNIGAFETLRSHSSVTRREPLPMKGQLLHWSKAAADPLSHSQRQHLGRSDRASGGQRIPDTRSEGQNSKREPAAFTNQGSRCRPTDRRSGFCSGSRGQLKQQRVPRGCWGDEAAATVKSRLAAEICPRQEPRLRGRALLLRQEAAAGRA